MGVDEGNLLHIILMVMGVERYILTTNIINCYFIVAVVA